MNEYIFREDLERVENDNVITGRNYEWKFSNRTHNLNLHQINLLKDHGENFSTSHPSYSSICAKLDPFDPSRWIESIMRKEKVSYARAVELTKERSLQASSRGTAMHEALEYMLEFNTNWDEAFEVCEQIGVDWLESIKLSNVLDELGKFETQEVLVMKDFLDENRGMMGYIDAVFMNEDNSVDIVDWKTSAKPKNPNYIDGYFKQVSLYAPMFFNTYGHRVRKCHIVIANPITPAQVFSLERREIQMWCNDFITNTFPKYFDS